MPRTRTTSSHRTTSGHMARLMDALPHAVLEVQPDGHILVANATARDWFGLDPVDGPAANGSQPSVFDLLAPASRNEVERWLTQPDTSESRIVRVSSDTAPSDTFEWTLSGLDGGNLLLSGRPVGEQANPASATPTSLPLEAILNSPADTSLLYVDRTHRVGLVTDAFHALLHRLSGHDVQVGDSIDTLATSDLFSDFQGTLDQALEGEVVHQECELLRDGEPHLVSVSFHPVRMGDRAPLGVTITTEDVSEQRRLERELHESLTRFQLLLNGVEEGIGITGEDETFVYVNPAGARIFGYDPDELIGRSLLEFIPSGEIERIEAESTRRAHHESSTYELTFVRADGEHRVMTVSAAPHKLENGLVQTMGVFRDITEERRVQDQLRQNAEQFELLLNGVEDGIVIGGGNDIFLYINPAGARILGYEEDELIGRSFLDFLPEDQRAIVHAQTQQRLLGKVSTYTLDFLRSDGDRRTMAITASPHKNDEGDYRTFVVFRDITETERAQRKAVAAAERFRAVFEQANDAMCLIDLETERFVDANGLFQEWSGYSLSELRELTPLDLTPDEFANKLSQDREALLHDGQLFFDLHLQSKLGVVHQLEATSKRVVIDGRDSVVMVARDVSERLQAQRALRESEARFRSVITSSPAGICILDEEGMFEYANASYVTLLGYEEDELLGRHHHLVVPDEYRLALADALDDLRERGIWSSLRIDLVTRSQQTITVIGEASLITGQDGRDKVALFFLDMTEQERALQALRSSEAYNAALVRALPDTVFRLSRDGVIVGYHAPEDAHLTLPRDQIIGARIDDLAIDHDRVLALRDNIRIALSRNVARVTEYSLHDGDETTYHEARLIPESDNQVLVLVRDISDRVREEERFRFQSQLLNAVQQAVIATDIHGRVTYWNSHAETMYGWTADEVIGKLLPKLQPDNPVPGRTFAVSRHLRPGQTWSGEVILQRRNGSELPVLASTSPIVNNAGQLIGTLGVTTDISSRKEYEKALKLARQAAEEASAAKSSFLTNMSHEIRTPMNSILGFTELLAEMIDDPQLVDYLQAVKSSASSLMQLITDILDLSRIEAGRMRLQPREVSPRDVLRDVRHLFEQNAREKGLDYRVQATPAVPETLEIDDIRLRQILTNLVGNAVKFTESGRVHLTLDAHPYEESADKVTLRIDVIDTGPGIPATQQGMIFEDFFQVENQDHRKYGGTGLGLAITQRLVSMMDGLISLQSTMGEGSHFSVTLPAVRRLDRNLPHGADDGEPDGPRFAPAEILLAEDEHFNRRLVQEYLSGQPCTLIEAEDGALALARIHERRPDLVLLDLRMPVMDGNEVLEHLRNDPTLRDIPVLVISASLVEREEQRARAAGARGFLRKPLGRRQLLDAMAEILPLEGDDAPVREDEPGPTSDPSGSDLAETLSSEALDELIHTLRDDLLGRWESLGRLFSRRTARELIDQLSQLAGKTNYSPLADYTAEAQQYLAHLQLERFVEHLDGLHGILDHLDQLQQTRYGTSDQ